MNDEAAFCGRVRLSEYFLFLYIINGFHFIKKKFIIIMGLVHREMSEICASHIFLFRRFRTLLGRESLTSHVKY